MSQNDKVAPQSVEDSSQNEDLSTLVEPNYNTLEDHLDDCDEDDDDDGDSSLKKNESQKAVSAERLKAFNMFVRLFIDENLDRLVPISKQPKEKINAIIMSCQRQFPEFEDRARKRIRTYLKSCRRSIRLREDSNKPTLYQPSSQPPEISHILAQACHNESHEAAKRQRIDADLQKDNRRNRFFSGSSVKKDTISPPFMSASSMNVELTHAEIISIKSLIDGYRQSASFLHRSADELESILKNARTPDVDTPAVKREDNRCPHGELLVSPTLELKRKAEQSLSTSSPTKAVCISSVKKERSSPSKSEFVKEISPSKSIKCDEEISPSKSNKFDGEEQLKKKDDDSKEPDKFDQEQDSTTSIRLLEATRLQSNNESDIAGESQTNTSRKNFNESSHVVESSSDEPLVSSQPSLKQHSYQNDSNEITPVLYIPDMSKPRIDISKPRNDRVLKEKTSQILTHSPIYSKRLQYASAQHNRNLSPIPTSNSSDHRFENERFETHQQRHTEMNGERILHHASMASAQQFRNANSTYHNSHPGHISSSGQSPCSDESSYDLHQKRISQENFYVDAPSPKHSSTNISLYTKPQLSPKLHITQYTGSRSSFEGNLRSQTIVYSPRQTAQQVRYHVGQQSRQNQFNNYSVFNFDSPSPQPYYENRQQHQQQNFHPVLSPQNVSYHSVMSPNHSPLVQDLPRQTHFSDLNRQSHYHDASPHGEYTHFDIHPMHK